MVSVPGINPSGQGVTDWWPGLTGNVFGYSMGYILVTTTTPGEGYWMKHTGTQVYNYPVTEIVPHDPIDCSGGWNLFGVYEEPLDTADLIGIVPPVYGYFGGGYIIVDSLFPGYSYWARCSGSQIIFPDGKLRPRLNFTSNYFKEEWGKIIITDATGNKFTLYAADGDSPGGGAGVNLDSYEMPPKPPAGVFDVRFESNRIAEYLNSEFKTILLSATVHPIIVKVERMNIRLQDETGNLKEAFLKSGEEITIGNKQVSRLMVKGDVIPDLYALEQNYPNPFNPSTVIQYSLPQTENVKLIIYNLLGEQVDVLVDEYQQAGKYKFNFDASSLPSGIYFYRIIAGSFSQTNKMLLVK
jgi:hypothetical protein